MPWTIPVVGAGGVTTVEEGTVGASAAPHAVSSDITAQSAHVGAILRAIGESARNIEKWSGRRARNDPRMAPQFVDVKRPIADRAAHVARQPHHCCRLGTPNAKNWRAQ